VRRHRGAAALPKRWAIAVAAGALAAGAAFGDALVSGLVGSPERPVDAIAVSGARHLAPSAVAGAAAVARGSASGDLDPERVARALTEHPWIASARTLFLPGGTLLVGVVEREPVATVTIAKAVYAVDREGRPFAALDAPPDPALPEIVARHEVRPGEADPRLAEAVRLARRLPELGLAAPAQVEVAADDDAEGYALRLASPDTRVVLGRTELDARLTALARLFAHRPDEAAGAQEIDVRFADQLVLRGSPAQDESAETAPDRGRGAARSRRPTG
jgi:cell division septal protein FtsQ